MSSLLPEPNHAEILRSGPKAWNAWRDKNPATIPDLTGIALKLSERQMGPTHGGPANLKSARLQDAFLRFATFSAADLEAADMSGADLVHARLDHANLSTANLSNALLDHADFAGANLAKVNLRGANSRFATLSAADLEAADMSGADLVHAQFDGANLTAANLSNALLDHADFAGANLSQANLSGASLYHAKNLTHEQLEESIGSDSTILPPYLLGAASWSVEVGQTATAASESRDLRPAQPKADEDFTHIDAHNSRAWIVAALLIGGSLVTAGSVWQHMKEIVPAQIRQGGPEKSLTRSSPDVGGQSLKSSASESAMGDKEPDQRSADAEISRSVATVDRSETVPGAQSASKQSLTSVPADGVQELQPSAPQALREEKAPAQHTELKAISGAESIETFETNEHASEDSERDRKPHAIVRAAGSSQEGTSAHALPEVSPESLLRHATIKDLSTKAHIPALRLPLATEVPPEPLALNTSEPPALALRDPVPPHVVTARLPSSKEQIDVGLALPSDTQLPPLPVRKPIQKDETKSPPNRQTASSKQDNKPVIPKGGAKSTPDRAGTSLKKKETKTVVQRGEVGAKQPDRGRQVQRQSTVDKKSNRGSGGGSITDVLTGGL